MGGTIHLQPTWQSFSHLRLRENSEVLVKSTLQRHRLIKRSRSGHRTLDCFPSPDTSSPRCGCCSVTESCLIFVTPWTEARQAPLSFTNYQSLLTAMSIHVHSIYHHITMGKPSNPIHCIQVNQKKYKTYKRWKRSFNFKRPSKQHNQILIQLVC